MFLHLENATALHVVIDREGIDLGGGRVCLDWDDNSPGQSGQDHQKGTGSSPERIGRQRGSRAWRRTCAIALQNSASCFRHRRGELATPRSRPINLTVEQRTVDIIDIEALGFGQRLVAMVVSGLGGALSG